MTLKMTPAQAISYELKIVVKAAKEDVWRALTKDVNAWWLADFHMVGADSVIRFDAKAGGQLIEEQGGGGSLLWYTVQMCQPGQAIYLAGFIAPQWGGPATTMLSLELEDVAGGTLLKVQDAIFGHIDVNTANSLKAGWSALFGDGLRAYVEGAN